MNIRTLLHTTIRNAMTLAGIPEHLSPLVAPSKAPAGKQTAFGDYQANGAMGAAKVMQCKPRDLAQKIVDELKHSKGLDGIAQKLEIAGPGFINIHLEPAFLADTLATTAKDTQLGVTKAASADTVVIDYSSPNLAKEMHVGHLRSTIIGDASARILEFAGHKVIRQNHVGDWGTQFGMLIAELNDKMDAGASAELALGDLEVFYQQSKKRFDNEPDFAERARNNVVKLQSGDAEVLKSWEGFRRVSLSHSDDIYKLLNVTLTESDVYGESAYNDALAPIVSELKDTGIAQEDDGATVVFLEELADKEGNPSVAIIQKKDGGYLYATTDLAAIRYRANTLKANRIEYFIDDRQSLHMKQVFAIVRKAGFVQDGTRLEHRAFGKMLGKDGKPFKTRTGGTIKLADLLHEAIDKAADVVKTKNADLDAESMRAVAKKVGIGAVKYADLSKTRTNDYIFDWDAMLSFEGNTGPYLQYAYTRIASVFRKADTDIDTFNAPVQLLHAQEKALALKLLRFPEVIEQVIEDAYPHVLCHYLYELASLFMSFYEACPILKSDVSDAEKLSRLQLCKNSALTLKKGLALLGIDVMERM